MDGRAKIIFPHRLVRECLVSRTDKALRFSFLGWKCNMVRHWLVKSGAAIYMVLNSEESITSNLTFERDSPKSGRAPQFYVRS